MAPLYNTDSASSCWCLMMLSDQSCSFTSAQILTDTCWMWVLAEGRGWDGVNLVVLVQFIAQLLHGTGDWIQGCYTSWCWQCENPEICSTNDMWWRWGSWPWSLMCSRQHYTDAGHLNSRENDPNAVRKCYSKSLILILWWYLGQNKTLNCHTDHWSGICCNVCSLSVACLKCPLVKLPVTLSI